MIATILISVLISIAIIGPFVLLVSDMDRNYLLLEMEKRRGEMLDLVKQQRELRKDGEE